MALKQRIEDDLKAALLGGDRFASETLRGLKAAILNEEVAQNRRSEGLDDSDIEKIIAKELKKRQESATLYGANGREDLAESERREGELLVVYLPKQLSEGELKSVVQGKIRELGASDMKMMGQVISAVKEEVGNMAGGSEIASLVKSMLSLK